MFDACVCLGSFRYLESCTIGVIIGVRGQPISWHPRCSASAMVHGAFLACIPTLLTDRFVGTSFSQHDCSPSETPPIPIQPTTRELPYHVLETFRKLLHILYAAIEAFWKQALGRGRSSVCNPGCFSRAASAARAGAAASTYHMVQDQPRTLPLQWNADRLGSRYCWTSKTSPSKGLSMTTTLFDARI